MNFKNINNIQRKMKVIAKTILLSLLTFLQSNLFSQNIISRNASDYPGGSLNIDCLSSPYTNCVITLPFAKYNDNYSFTIPLKAGITRSDIVFVFTQTTNCSEGTISFTSDGKIEILAESSCLPEIGNYIEIDLEVISNKDGTSDTQKFYLPIHREPLKIVLVLDISSNMSLPVPGGTNSRWDVLKKSVNLFTKKFEKYYQEGDSISVIYYSTDTVMPSEPIGNKFIAITPEDFTPTNLKSSEIISSDMQNITLQDSAAMGEALLLAKSKLANTDATKIVLLFTDGNQKVKPFINKFGNKLSNGEYLNETPCDNIDNLLYYTIGMGDITLIPEILNEIALATGGVAVTTTTGNEEGDLYNFFQNQFEDIFFRKTQPVNTRIVDLAPFDDSLNVPLSSNLSLEFNEKVYTNSGYITIKRGKDDTIFESIDVTSGQVTGSGANLITINPTPNFESSTDYYVSIDGTAFKNENNINFSGVSSKSLWNFTTLDLISPSETISSLEKNPTNSNPISININFSEEIKGFTAEDITVSNGVPSNLNTSDNTNFTADITPTADGLVTIRINSSTVTDRSGNSNTASNVLKLRYDSTRPSVTLTADDDSTITAQFNAYVNFSERILGFNKTKIGVSNGNVNTLSTTDSVDFVAAITAISKGEVNVNIAENQVADSAGNKNTPATELDVIYYDPTSVETLEKDGISIYSSQGYVIVEFKNPNALNFQQGSIEVYALNGSLIKKERIFRGGTFKTFLSNKQEIVLVKLSLGKKNYYSKLVTG